MCGVYDATPHLLTLIRYIKMRELKLLALGLVLSMALISANAVSFKSPVEDGLSMMGHRDILGFSMMGHKSVSEFNMAGHK